MIWNDRGLVLTNDHVARRSKVIVETSSGARYTAPVIARDRDNDLAAILVNDARPLRSIDHGDSSNLKVGQLVVAVGHPMGWRYFPTAGIVTARPDRPRYGKGERNLLKLDVSLAPGNSGGPIVDSEGRLVGLACMIAGPGLSLAVPSSVMAAFAKWAESRISVAA